MNSGAYEVRDGSSFSVTGEADAATGDDLADIVMQEGGSTRSLWDRYLKVSTPLIAVFLAMTGPVALPYRLASACLVAIPSVVYLAVIGPYNEDSVNRYKRGRWGSKSGTSGWVFAILTVACLLMAYACNPRSTYAQVFLITELFIAFTYQAALWMVVLINVGFIAVTVAQTWMPTPSSLANMVATCGISVLFSAMIGGAVDQIVRMNNRNKHLVSLLLEQQERIRRLSTYEGMMAERQRVAGEVHDTLAQSLASMLALGRAATEESRSGDREHLETHLTMITALAQEGLDDARQLVTDGMPVVLRHQGLLDALNRTVQRFARETGIRATCEGEGDLDLVLGSQQLQVAILRIVQEALTNVRNHAQAQDVEVNVIQVRDNGGDRIVVTIADDGNGFDLAAHESEDGTGYEEHGHGYGLVDMRRRALQLGGVVHIDSAQGLGTTVQAVFPVDGGAGGEVPIAGGNDE